MKAVPIALLFFASVTLAADPFPAPAVDLPVAPDHPISTLVLAGGCFWGMEGVFERLKGVANVVSGYAGGAANTATYEEVETGRTGHAESIQITYDPAQITFGELLQVFFSVAHNPTELNRQGPDEGTQYRSAIFYTTEQEKKVAQAYIQQLNKAKVYHWPIVTQVTALPGFYPAEPYHQHFLQNNPENPYIVFNDLPKIKNLEREYPSLVK